MKRKVKFIIFHIKNCSKALYECRTCSPYIYRKYSKRPVTVKRVMCQHEKIITKHCRVNDILKVMNTDSSFPTNSTDYINVLIAVTENSNRFFDSMSMMSGNNETQRLLGIAFDSIESVYPIIEEMLYNELETVYAIHIKSQAKVLRFNLLICMEALNQIYDIGEDDWMATLPVENLEHYISHLKRTCNFVYIIILKKRSSNVKKMFSKPNSIQHSISPTNSYYICSICGEPEVVCTCFACLESTSNNNQDNLPETVEKVKNIEDVPHCSKSTASKGVKNAGFWNGPFQNYSDSQGSDTD